MQATQNLRGRETIMDVERKRLTKPEKSVQLGNFIICHKESDTEYGKKLVDKYYQEFKERHEHNDGKSWCKFNDYQLIIKEKTYDPMHCYTSIGIKWNATGRAFYIKRNFRDLKKAYRYHPNKRCVPKKKRGRKILQNHSCNPFRTPTFCK